MIKQQLLNNSYYILQYLFISISFLSFPLLPRGGHFPYFENHRCTGQLHTTYFYTNTHTHTHSYLRAIQQLRLKDSQSAGLKMPPVWARCRGGCGSGCVSAAALLLELLLPELLLLLPEPPLATAHVHTVPEHTGTSRCRVLTQHCNYSEKWLALYGCFIMLLPSQRRPVHQHRVTHALIQMEIFFFKSRMFSFGLTDVKWY